MGVGCPEGQVEIGLGWLPFHPGYVLIVAAPVTPLVNLKTNTEEVRNRSK